MALFLKTCLVFFLVFSVVSCVHTAGDLNGFQTVEGDYQGTGRDDDKPWRFEESVDALEGPVLKRFVLKPVFADDGNLFSERGILGEPVRAQSGERLEIRWEGFFPRYRLYYFPSPERPGVVIGECRFADGCNNGFFFAPDNDGDGIPDVFRLVQWTSIDYGGDDGVPGYLDRFRYIYDVAKDRFCLWHDLLVYQCRPPLSIPPDTCRTVCDKPFETRTVKGKTYPRVLKTRLLEDRPLFRDAQ